MAHKLFVGGLNFATSNERLRELFAECGQVDSATVVTDRDTGRSRGFGFVEMGSAEEAEQAISKFNGQEIDGRRLQVEKAKEGGAGGGARRSGGGFGGGGGNRGGYGGGGGGSRRW
jgi:RNA recognition motif-containing protein